MKRLFGLLAAMGLFLSTEALASGTVPCSGVTNTGGMDRLTKLGWQAFWGSGNHPGEVWLDNHTRVTVHVIVYGTDMFVENALVAPGSVTTMYVPNRVDIVRVECSYWSDSQAHKNFGFSSSFFSNSGATIGGGGGSGNGGGADPDYYDNDYGYDDSVDPDDLGGVSVDVDPTAKESDLGDLRSKILKAL